MPGIVGLITKRPRAWAEPQLLTMVESMKHETFYESGTWSDESMGVYVGWTARKNSFDAGMPIQSALRDVVLIFSGEEFPEPGVICSLKDRGYDVAPENASYLVHVYEEDPNFPSGLNGRFQGLVADRRLGTVTLFNDRYGMHKIYFHEADCALYFSAEAKAILKVRPELRSVDSRSLAEMVVWRCVADDRTIFKGIRTLPPGAKWVFQHGAVLRSDAYFRPAEWENQAHLTSESYYPTLRDAFVQNLPRYFRSRERIGMSLTGGLDTRMIMAWQQPPPESLPCYTFGGMYRDCQDVIVARRVSGSCRQSHEVIPVNGAFLSKFPHYAERTVFLTDGFAPVDLAPDLYVQEKARQIAPVRISGNYGSEVLRGLVGFKPAKFAADIFDPELHAQMETSKETFAQTRPRHPVSCVAFQQTRMRAVDALEHTQVAVRSPYLDNDLVRTAFRAPEIRFAKSDIFADNDVCNRLIADGNRALRNIRTDRGLAGPPGWRTTVAKWMLEFTFKAEYAYDYGMPQWLARIDHRLSPLHLERLFLGRHKFVHFRTWYRGALSGYVGEMLLDSRTLSRPYLQRKKIETIVRRHLKGDHNYTSEIHLLLTLELIHRLFVDR